MPVNNAKIQVKLPNEIILRILSLTQEQFEGNITKYVTRAILDDLLNRQILTMPEFNMLIDDNVLAQAICTSCGKNLAWHQEYNPNHLFRVKINPQTGVKG